LDTLNVVGWIHVQNDPRPSGFTTSAEGGSDWAVAESMIQAGSADPNLVTYIATPGGEVYEYTIDQKNTNEVGQLLGRNGGC